MDHIKFNLFVPYPGSDIWDELLEKGEINNMNFDEYTSFPSYTNVAPPFIPKGRTHDELVQLQRKAMKLALFRKKVIIRELKNFQISNLGQYFVAVKALLFPPPIDTTSDRFKVVDPLP